MQWQMGESYDFFIPIYTWRLTLPLWAAERLIRKLGDIS